MKKFEKIWWACVVIAAAFISVFVIAGIEGNLAVCEYALGIGAVATFLALAAKLIQELRSRYC